MFYTISLERDHGWSGKTWATWKDYSEPLIYESGGEHPPSDQTKERLRNKNRKAKKAQRKARRSQR